MNLRHDAHFLRKFAASAITAASAMATAACAQTQVFLNEIHYDNASTDVGEFIEIAGPAGVDLSGWEAVLYNGTNSVRAPYGTIALSGVIPDQQNGFGTLAFSRAGIQNGSPDGLALVDPSGAVQQFLSYEGVFTALSGPAAGMTSTDIGASESSSTPVGFSLQLSGTGLVFEDFVFASAAPNTQGAVNANQTFDSPVPPPVVTISEIQGAGHRSPFEGDVVQTSGVVTVVAGNGFYLQDPDDDFDPNTSEGVFVFTGSTPSVAPLDEIDIKGSVVEFKPGGSGTDNLTITQVSNPMITITGAADTLPAPVRIGGDARFTPPNAIIDNDQFLTFDPSEDGIDFYESLEGMRVEIVNPFTVAPTNRFGEIWTRISGATGVNAEGGVTVSDGDFNPERIQIDDTLFPGTSPQFGVGTQLNTVTGVVSYAFGNFEVLPSEAPTTRTPGPLQPETTTLSSSSRHVTVASFNVENLDALDDQARFDQLGAIIAGNLGAPDILGLQEIQDNTGPTDDGVVAADETYRRLMDAIAAAGGPSYDFADIAPNNNADGGQPGGNIRVGYLYRPDRVSLSGVAGDADASTFVVDDGTGGADLTLNPGRISPMNAAFDNSRKPLAAKFDVLGETVFVVNTHSTSRGGSDPLFGEVQPPVIASDDKRLQQSEAIRDFVRQLLAVEPGARVVILGDFNALQFEAPLLTLEDAGALENLTDRLQPADRYSFIFEGNAQALDHILVSEGIGVKPTYDIVRVNASFADQAADHDPAVARLFLSPPRK